MNFKKRDSRLSTVVLGSILLSHCFARLHFLVPDARQVPASTAIVACITSGQDICQARPKTVGETYWLSLEKAKCEEAEHKLAWLGTPWQRGPTTCGWQQ
jgi:hypothetical protein